MAPDATALPSPRPLRILVAADVPNDRRGGMSRIQSFTGDAIAAAGHRVEYFCAEEAERAGARGPLERFTFPLAVLRHARLRARTGEPFDIVNCHEPSAAALALWRAHAGDPLLAVWSHGLERRAWRLALEERRLGRRGPSLRSRLANPATRLWQADLALRRADHVFCMSGEDAAWLHDRLGARCPPITRLFPAAGPGFAAAAAARDYARMERILFAGTWRKNKGIEDLVPALARLLAARPALTFTALGGGVAPGTVLDAFPRDVRPRVRCVTVDDDAATAREFAAHDLFVLPSLFEGTPLTLIEAMASGLPVVTTATCGMKDVVRDGENGLLVPLRDPAAIGAAVETLLGDAALRARLGSQARRVAAARYTWERVGGAMLEAYLAMAAARARGA